MNKRKLENNSLPQELKELHQYVVKEVNSELAKQSPETQQEIANNLKWKEFTKNRDLEREDIIKYRNNFFSLIFIVENLVAADYEINKEKKKQTY